MENYSPDDNKREEGAGRQEIVRIISDFQDAEDKPYEIEVDKNAPGLFLFDVDNTLIDSKKVHAPAVIGLFRETFGDKYNLPFEDAEFSKRFLAKYYSLWGLGDRREFELLCKDIGITFNSREEAEDVLDRMTKSYSAKIEEGIKASSPEERRSMMLPGVLEFLAEMKARKIPGALVTGNARRSAEAFAKHLDFGKYFITGGYDDDPNVTDVPYRRATILQSAVEKCKAKGLTFSPEQMAVFGDTSKDFEATLHQGEARPYVFLFATGENPLHTLREIADQSGTKKPHMALSSFRDIKIKPFFDSLEKYRKRD